MSKLFVNTIAPNSGDTVTVSGSLTTTGKLTIGDATSDTVVLTAEISSSIIPDADNTYDLGSSTKEWRNLYIDGTANIDMLEGGVLKASAGAFFNESDVTSSIVQGKATMQTASIGVVSSSLTPMLDNTYDLGSVSKEWRNLYIDGIAYVDSASITGEVVASTLRLTSTTDASVSSTGHAFQVGSTNSTNIIIDNNEIMARFNGAVRGLHLNPDGGIVTFGNSTSDTVNIESGSLNATSSIMQTASIGVVSSSLTPMLDNTYDLGSSTKEWKNLYIDGTANIDNADINSLEVGTISASALPTQKSLASPGQFYTLSGSQIPLSGSTAQLNLFSASLFVFMRE